MEGIVNFFSEIAGLIVTLVQFIVEGIQSAIHMLELIPSYIAFVYDLVASLPVFIQAFIFLLFAIMLIWFIRSLL